MYKLLGLLLLTTWSIAQPSAPYIFEKKTLKEVIELEKNLKSDSLRCKTIELGNTSQFAKNAVDGKTHYLKYQNTIDAFKPSYVVTYLFTEKDSTVYAAEYVWSIKTTWEINSSDYKSIRDVLWQQEINRRDDYIKKYNEIQNEVSKHLGNPYKVDDLYETLRGESARSHWQSNGRIIKLQYFSYFKLFEKKDFDNVNVCVYLSCDFQNHNP